MSVAVCLALLAAQGSPVKLEDPAVIAGGRAIFAARCGIGYCHGAEGRAGRGPRLAGRQWDKDYLFKAIHDGLNNSLMPPFKEQLSRQEIWSVVAYVLSLDGDQPAPAAVAEDVVRRPASAQTPPGAGDPERGRALFFDASNPKRCAACHRFQGRGADAAPDLTGVGSKTPRQILRDIVEPDAVLAVQALTVVTKSQERVTGLKQQETAELLRVWDMGALPPVLRTVYKDQIRSAAPDPRSPMPSDYGRLFTREQLMDLVAFLKSRPVAPNETAAQKP